MFRVVDPVAVHLKIAYCAVVAPIFVADESPSVDVKVTSASVLKTSVPAIAISRYCVKPLLVVSPQVPDSVPVTGRGRSKRVVRLTVIIYLKPVVIMGSDKRDVPVNAIFYSVSINSQSVS